jgi:carbonic anhydrase
MGHLTGLLGKIEPAVVAAKTSGERNSKNHEFVDEVSEINVGDTIKTIRAKSPILKELEDQGKIRIVGAVYDTSDGKIHWQ